MRVYAHRGASAELPENTLPAFERALELGVDALELDLHRTRDGVIVVSHNPDGRNAGRSERIEDATLADVRTWNLGGGARIPTFEEVLRAFPETPLNVDLKVPIADEAVALLRERKAAKRVCLASFQAATMRHVRAIGYEGPTALAKAEVALLLALPAWAQQGPLRPKATAAQLPISLGRRWVVRRCRRLGLRAEFWTVNDAATARQMIDLGVDGIMTDDPRTILPIVRSGSSLRPASP